tara:strand:+ start:7012 stop:7476 length:465 start_codon:yes stop_codon:yes gene_type:complete
MSSALAIAAIAATVVGAGVSAAGAVQQGKSAQNLANYNAQIAQNDAIAARQKAEFDAKAQERQAALLQGTQRASIAASGGSLLDAGDVVDMTAEELELENLAIRYGGETGFRAGQQRAQVASFEGAVAGQKAKGEVGKALITGATSALTQGSKI